MAKRPAKYSRSQDQARLAEEKATGRAKPSKPAATSKKPATPTPSPKKQGRPRKYAGETQEERDRARDQVRREAKKRARNAAFKPPAPPSAVDDEKTIEQEVSGSGPPLVEPDLGPVDTEGAPLSHLWSLMRGSYDAKTRALIDTMVTRQKLELQDLVYLEFAEHAVLLSQRTRDTTIAALQSRKQIARLLVARGPIGGVNDQVVRVPEGLDLDSLAEFATPGTGDDIHATPRPEDLPARYRSTAG